MNKLNKVLVTIPFVLVLLLGFIPSKLAVSFDGKSSLSVTQAIYHQDGIGFSGPITQSNEIEGTYFTGYQNWPNGVINGNSMFSGGVYDGTNIWLIPYNANSVVKFNPTTDEMTAYNNWPAGFTKGINAFAGGVFDGENIWLIPYSATDLIKINPSTGQMESYNNWPDGSKGIDQFIGAAFDGTHIWLAPYNGNRVIKVDLDGNMSSYNSWPIGTTLDSYPFAGLIFDGTDIWFIPHNANRIVKMELSTGNMIGYNNWPSDYTKSASAFMGGVFDGSYIWLIPYNSTHLIRFNPADGTMEKYNEWPAGFNKSSSSSFAGGVYDGSNIWLIPQNASSLIKVDPTTGDMTKYDNYPSDFVKPSAAFFGGVYDGQNLWMIPFRTDRLMKFGESKELGGLTLSSGSLSPSFAGATISYSTSVANNINSIDIMPTLVDANATVTVNGTAANSSEAVTVPLIIGNNTISIVVTTKSGDAKTYTVLVSRPASTNADLNGLTLNSGALSPVFSSAELSYTTSVDHTVSSIDIMPVVADNEATVTVNGATAVSGTATSIPLNVGSNPITIVVTASDGISTKTYLVEVTRAASTNADLSGLTLSSGTLSPVFSGAAISYTTNVSHDVVNIDLTPVVADVGATITVNGTAVVSGTATSIPLNVGSNPITVVVAAASGVTKTYTVDVTRANSTSNGGGNGGINTNVPNPNPNSNTIMMINGKLVNFGEITTAYRQNQRVTTVAVGSDIFEQLQNSVNERPILTISDNSETDVIVGQLSADLIKRLADNNAILEIKSEKGSYTLAFKDIDLEAILLQAAPTVELKDIMVQIEVGESSTETMQRAEEAAKHSNVSILVPPMDFSVNVTFNHTQLEVNNFNTYMQRTITIPDNVDRSRITTGVVLDENGLLRHVPTMVIQQDGKWVVRILSLTNSTYLAVEKVAAFSDVDQNHWASLAIHDMGNRLIVEGTEETRFNPTKPITRAEFTAMVVRALGIKLEGASNTFTDVTETNWYNDAVQAASAYKLVSGFEDGRFKPSESITREEAMLIISKAMTITGLKAQLPFQEATMTLHPFIDGEDASLWARDGVALSIQAGIVEGRSGEYLALKQNITRAEVAVMLHKLLKKSSLID